MVRTAETKSSATNTIDLLTPDTALQISDLEGLLLQSGPGERAPRQS